MSGMGTVTLDERMNEWRELGQEQSRLLEFGIAVTQNLPAATPPLLHVGSNKRKGLRNFINININLLQGGPRMTVPRMVVHVNAGNWRLGS